ncbi:calcium/sodium antiporter [Muribaculum sp.]|uniref:calcium/sodium antiporter n=1 Tax=Muribaculum sp. TaxID=1918611 RepID=UPI0023D3BA04|nr:calcium/sodium antiporter [Muribaculum sp.]MDE5705792.1 calcium/sodium antiporter [Muribaculum sp.]
MLFDILLLVAGLAMILVGANWLTDGGSGVAKRFGISELVIGLTIVAFGTSAPELVISVMSAMKGSAGLAIGNVVGSNIFNVLMIIGIVAMVRPIKVEHSIMTNEIPLVVLASVALLACGNGHLLDGDMTDMVTRVDGILLLLFFAIFMRYTFSIAKASPSTPDSEVQQESVQPTVSMPMWKACGMIVLGLAALVWGGDVFVDSASSLARAMGVSDAVIGLTIVAAGTSLPELATSVVAATKGRPGLAVGNVIGSCLFNIFFVLGLSAVIRPLPLGSIGNLDLLVMTGAALLFWLFGWIIGHRTITRTEGAILVLLYIAYTTVLIVNA